MTAIEQIKNNPESWRKEDMQQMCSAAENTLPTTALQDAFALPFVDRTMQQNKMIAAHLEAQEAIHEECQTTGQQYMLWSTMIFWQIERCIEVGAWDAEAAVALFVRQ